MICLFDLTLLFSRFCPFCTIHTRTYKGEQYFMSLYKIIFSPTGGTQKAADAVAQAWKNPAKLIDLTREPECTITFTEEDIVLLAVPSYGGRVPAPAARRLTSLHGSQTPCILVCVYGNRAYEDTLTELQDLAVKQGLHVIAAVTAVAEHSILHQYAAGRPDTEDIRILRNFGEKIFQQIKSGPVQETVLSLPGSRPYKAYGGVGMIPKANKNCTKCGLYSKNYPTQPPLHRLRAQTRRNASPVCAASPDAPFRPGKSVASCCPLSPWH